MRRHVGVALAVMALASCSGPEQSDAFELGEYFVSGPSELSGHDAGITVSNVGEFPHTLVVTTMSGDVVTATGLIQPEAAATLELALDPGAYQFTCRIVAQGDDGSLIDHFAKGMHRNVSVSA